MRGCVILSMKTRMANDLTHIMEGVGSFVHATIQQFGDAKLLYASSDFIGGSTQDVIRLEKEVFP